MYWGGGGGRVQKEAKKRTEGKEAWWLSEAPVRNVILQMHTPAPTSQCWRRQTSVDSGCASGCTWSTARATGRFGLVWSATGPWPHRLKVSEGLRHGAQRSSIPGATSLPWRLPAHGVCTCAAIRSPGFGTLREWIQRSLACSSDVQPLDQPFRGAGRGGPKVGGGGRGVWLGPPSSQGPPAVPAEGGPKFLKLKSSWHRPGLQVQWQYRAGAYQ